MFDSVSIVVSIGVILLVHCLVIALRPGLRSLPGPWLAKVTDLYRTGLVFTGNGPERYRRMHDKYGMYVRTGPNSVSISDPKCIPVIYGIGSQFMKTNFYDMLTPTYQSRKLPSTFTTRSPAEHKALKQPVAQLFSLSHMHNFEAHVDECTELFCATMRDLEAEGATVDIAAWLQWYAFDVIAMITFRRRFGFIESRKDVHSMIAKIDWGLGMVGKLSAYPWLLLSVKEVVGSFSQAFRDMDPLIRFLEMTEEELKTYDQSDKDESRTDFLALLRKRESKLGAVNSHTDMINHLSNNLLAGSDTTAISLRACFYYLIKTPDAMRKLRKELQDAEAEGSISNPITLAEALKLPYLQAVMKEAMRLHPGVGFPLERYVPPGGAEVGPVHLPGGTIVSMTAPVVHLNKEIFGSDSDKFRPERWLNADPARYGAMERTLLTFGHGARTCIGKNISIMEMAKFIPQVMRSFDIEWASADKEWKTHAAWFWRQRDMPVRFKSRPASSQG